jgi:hypothetical protein
MVEVCYCGETWNKSLQESLLVQPIICKLGSWSHKSNYHNLTLEFLKLSLTKQAYIVPFLWSALPGNVLKIRLCKAFAFHRIFSWLSMDFPLPYFPPYPIPAIIIDRWCSRRYFLLKVIMGSLVPQNSVSWTTLCWYSALFSSTLIQLTQF